jgi:hypothetical protein
VARREIQGGFGHTIREAGARCRRRFGETQRIVGETDARSRRFGADSEVRIREVVGFELGQRQAKRVGDRQLGGDDVREG